MESIEASSRPRSAESRITTLGSSPASITVTRGDRPESNSARTRSRAFSLAISIKDFSPTDAFMDALESMTIATLCPSARLVSITGRASASASSATMRRCRKNRAVGDNRCHGMLPSRSLTARFQSKMLDTSTGRLRRRSMYITSTNPAPIAPAIRPAIGARKVNRPTPARARATPQRLRHPSHAHDRAGTQCRIHRSHATHPGTRRA